MFTRSFATINPVSGKIGQITYGKDYTMSSGSSQFGFTLEGSPNTWYFITDNSYGVTSTDLKNLYALLLIAKTNAFAIMFNYTNDPQGNFIGVNAGMYGLRLAP